MQDRRGRQWTGNTKLILAGAIVVATVLRLNGLELGSINHIEAYIPGIDLPAGISEPPPRHTFAEALWWHFHDEPHPIGWYLAMFGWTSLAGTSEWALRFPSMVFGVASLPLIFLVGREIYGRSVGTLASVLFALHGFHLFWSQQSRMWAAGVFLGLLSTWLLLRIARSQSPRPRIELAYVLTCIAGVQTVELFWPLLLLHVAWAGLMMSEPGPMPASLVRRPHLQGPRLVQVQAVALMLAAPAILHAAYRARGGAVGGPEVGFLFDYLSFGFLFAPDYNAIPAIVPPPFLAWLVFAAAVFLIAASLRAAARTPPIIPTGLPALPGWLAPAVAVASTALMLWLASIAHKRNLILLVMAFLPMLALTAPALAQAIRNLVARVGAFERWLRAADPGVLVLWLLGLFAPIALYVASYVLSVIAARAFLLFVPFLVVIAAAGALHVVRLRSLRAGIVAASVVLFAMSVPYAAKKPKSPRDYKTIAQHMLPLMHSDDLVLVRHRDWADTPYFYYIPNANYVTGDYAETLAASPDKRVWLLTWPWEGMPVVTDARRLALSEYERIAHFEALRASAELFVPKGGR